MSQEHFSKGRLQGRIYIPWDRGQEFFLVFFLSFSFPPSGRQKKEPMCPGSSQKNWISGSSVCFEKMLLGSKHLQE